METTAAPSLLPHLWKTALVTGILAIILGVLVFIRPGAAIFVTAIFFGAYLLITGISQLVLAFSLRSSVGGRVLLFIGGAAALVLAVLCFVNLQDSVQLLAIWIGVGFIFRGVATAMSAIGDPSLPGRIWEIIVGIVSVIAGIIMFVAPLEGLVALTQVTGIILIVVGVFEVISAFGIRSDAKKLKAAISPQAPTVT
ncbi:MULTISPECIES: HdeD family acid-resistance protein [unclassified Mycolicibacterium]|uniref:HdeD family acid-resistance protein n=1 Tax=unclassified Mycolicibacterium TaxID=2636767 RepID=UPI0012DD1973|nr:MULTISPECIES: HdeD family acid-resistance protein [unclassified Mycolicibacterium]MUL84637.1 HdeD family acid-resistance protein [Mycolicibacterium sp. CBMA 329]MUL88412.1 HdeD family acid-resistance protein [Mycolicibacterium sp. CBMA 331]MUM03051.1 HdeD family acid-resistance protein [Mycolicibacterium sp. CBMA 334]MUM25099.1 HdeD family acid-resistance protein [Mycolicibacterium sp. CBMA 295]MUM40059.1 HdeD family acid-resistance protein [Mycolicibacterium sp. CBMA 247]